MVDVGSSVVDSVVDSANGVVVSIDDVFAMALVVVCIRVDSSNVPSLVWASVSLAFGSLAIISFKILDRFSSDKVEVVVCSVVVVVVDVVLVVVVSVVVG